MKKIKVMNIITDVNIGGAGKVLVNYIKHHNSKRYDVSIVLPKGSLLKPMLEQYTNNIYTLNQLKDKSLDINAIGSLYNLIKEISPDIVHTHASFSARIAARLYGKCKIVYTRHCAYEPTAFQKSIIGKFLRNTSARLFSNHIIAISGAVKNNLVQMGVPAKMITPLLNGVEPLKHLNEKSKSDIKKQYGISPNDKVVGIVARLEPVKGHKYFIEAAKICLKEMDNIKFIIAGTGSYEKEIKCLIQENNLSSKIILTGFVNKVENIMNILDINANASYGTEASSLSLLEGMSLGKPMVASNYGGNPYMIEEGQNGFLFPEKNSSKMADFIIKLLSNEELYDEMSIKTLEIYNKKYTANIMAENIEKIYELC